MLLQPRAGRDHSACLVAFTFYLSGDLSVTPLASGYSVLTYGLYESGAGWLDHHVRVQQDGLQQGLRVGGQLGDQRSQSQVDPQAVVWKLANPGYYCELSERGQSGCTWLELS